MYRLLPILAALALSTPVLAGGSRPAMPELQSRVPDYALDTRDYNFPSGIRIILQQDSSAPMVAITTLIDAGSAKDPAGKEGVAHMAEHLWFESQHSGLKVKDVIYELGGDYDARTNADYTSYATLGPVDALPFLLKLESLRLTEAAAGVAEEDFAFVGQLMQQEYRYRYNGSWESARPEIMRRLFPEGHPYAVLGAGERVDQLALSDVEAFTAAHFKPENTTIMIVGNFDLTKATDAVFENIAPELLHPDLTQEHMQRWARNDIENPDPNNPDHSMIWPQDPNSDDEMALLELRETPKARITDDAPTLPDPPDVKSLTTVRGPVETPIVLTAWALPGAYRGHEPIVKIAANTLSNNIMVHFMDDPTIVKGSNGAPLVACFSDGLQEATLLVCGVQVEPDANRPRVASGIIDQVAALWNPELAAQLQQQSAGGIRQSMTDVLHSLDVVANLGGGRAMVTARHAHFTGRTSYHADQLNAIAQSQPKDLSEFAHNYLQRNRAVMVSIDTLAPGEFLPEPPGYHGALFKTELGNLDNAAGMDVDTLREAFAGPDLSQLKEKTLANGLRVVVVPHGDAPLVRASMITGGGYHSEPRGIDDYTSMLQFRSVWSPEPNRDPILINATSQIYRTSDFAVEALKGAAGNLDGMLWLLRDLVEERKPTFELKSGWVRATREAIEGRWHSSGYWRDRTENDRVMPGHVSHWQLGWDELEAMKENGATEVRAYLDKKHQPANTTLLIVGMVDPDEAIAEVEKQFGGWSATGEVGAIPVVAPPPEPKKGGVFLLDDELPNVAIRARCAPQAWDADNLAAISLLGSLYDEQMRTAVAKVEPLYPSGARVDVMPGGAAVAVATANASFDHAAAVTQAMRGVLDGLAQGEISEDRLRLHQMHMARSHATGHQSIDQLTDALAGLARDEKRGWDWFDKLGDEIAETTPADLQEALGHCAENAVVTILGPADSIAPQLDAAGIAYEVVDWVALGDAEMQAHDPKGYKKLLKDRAKGK